MGIVGYRPETGVRLDVERPRDDGPPWRYEGEVITPNSSFRVRATVSAEGVVLVELTPEVSYPFAERVRLLLRAAWKHAYDGEESERAPPRRIVRWRADR